MSSFVIQGGKRLNGEIKVNTAKNSAVALLCASLLIKGKVVLKDVPRIQEVDRILEILKSIGVSYKWSNEHVLSLDTGGELSLEKIDRKACEATRSSLLLFGSLAARAGAYKLYKAGGCKLGERTVRPHLFALEKLGIVISSREEYYGVVVKKLKGAEVVMYEAGDTPTENAVMAAALAEGETTIKFASANYMVQDLCWFLNEAGARIEGVGTSTLRIRGVTRLCLQKAYHVMPDPIEAMAFIAAAVVTKSNLKIKNCPVDFLELELEKLRVMGLKYSLINAVKSKNSHFRIVDIQILRSSLTALPDKIHGLPFPGINIDNIPFFVPIATQARGMMMIHDWMYENRTVYYLEFQKLGAKITLLDPHRVFIEGPTALKGRELVAPDGIRPAAALFIGMLGASGKSVLHNTYVIERGYEDLPKRLKAVGADIEYLK